MDSSRSSSLVRCFDWEFVQQPHLPGRNNTAALAQQAGTVSNHSFSPSAGTERPVAGCEEHNPDQPQAFPFAFPFRSLFYPGQIYSRPHSLWPLEEPRWISLSEELPSPTLINTVCWHVHILQRWTIFHTKAMLRHGWWQHMQWCIAERPGITFLFSRPVCLTGSQAQPLKKPRSLWNEDTRQRAQEGRGGRGGGNRRDKGHQGMSAPPALADRWIAADLAGGQGAPVEMPCPFLTFASPLSFLSFSMHGGPLLCIFLLHILLNKPF